MLLRTILEAIAGKRARQKEKKKTYSSSSSHQSTANHHHHNHNRSSRQQHRSYYSSTNTGRRHDTSSTVPQRNSNNNGNSMPLAYALARSWAWPALKFRCETHPQEVGPEIAVDNRGETILHWTLLGKPPIETVGAILRVCPGMAKVRNNVGHLPLHVAISYRTSVEVIRALIEVFPESAGLPNGVGAYPLHLLCDYGCCVESFRAILETEAGAATIDQPMRPLMFSTATGTTTIRQQQQQQQQQQTPLMILTARMNYPVFARAIQAMQQARNRLQEQLLMQQQMQQQQQQQSHQEYDEWGVPLQQQRLFPGLPSNVAASDNDGGGGGSSVGEDGRRMISSFRQNDYWQKASLLVLVSYTQQPLPPKREHNDDGDIVVENDNVDDDEQRQQQATPSETQDLILHASAGIPDCPSFLLEFAILLQMEDLIQQKDDRGRLPLHVAAENHAKQLLATAAATTTAAASTSLATLEQTAIASMTKKRGRRRHSSSGGSSSSSSDSIDRPLRMILDACPAAAVVQDEDRSLPLIVALKEFQIQSHQHRQPSASAAGVTTNRSWSKGMQQLLEANVSALDTLNLNDGLYPYLWSNRLNGGVDQLFQSIRRHPDLFDRHQHQHQHHHHQQQVGR